VRWLHLETDNDPQLPAHGPKVFVGLVINAAAKYYQHIGNLAVLCKSLRNSIR